MTRISRLVLLNLFVLALIAAARAEPYETIISNGNPANRVDIAVLGDGYTAAEIDKYKADVQLAMQRYFEQQPYAEYKKYFNVHRIDVVSNESGADHSNRVPAVFVDTALDAAYNCSGIQRLVCINTSKVNAVIARTLPASYFDIVLTIVNDPEYGGSGGSIVVFSTNTFSAEIALHEVGHSFGLLADEYTGGGPSCNPNIEPSAANSTRETDRNLIKWRHWIDPLTPVPTVSVLAGFPGLYLGSSYCNVGLYRPTYNSKMRTLEFPFEQINSEQLVKRTYVFVSPIDSFSPALANVTLSVDQTQNFSITTVSPSTHSLAVTWLVDGAARASGPAFSFTGSSSATGTHTIQAVVIDSTPFVRNDPQSLLSESRSWTVNVRPPSQPIKFDFDGDGKADLSVRRPSDNSWYFLRTTAGFTGFQYGLSGDMLAPADYDGDGKTDVAVFRPTNGTWYVLGSSAGFYNAAWGLAGDIPVPADYDGDGKADLAVYRPSDATWYRKLSTGPVSYIQFGTQEDKPQIGDFDGDGKADLVVYRPSNNNWYFLKSGGGFNGYQWGLAGDIPAPADYDGDGKTDAAVFRPSEGNWYIAGSQFGFATFNWGLAGDVPVAADYDGDGKADTAVFRPSNNTWHIRTTGAGIAQTQFGAAGDVPVPSAFAY